MDSIRNGVWHETPPFGRAQHFVLPQNEAALHFPPGAAQTARIRIPYPPGGPGDFAEAEENLQRTELTQLDI
jgi:hypothetical protein